MKLVFSKWNKNAKKEFSLYSMSLKRKINDMSSKLKRMKFLSYKPKINAEARESGHQKYEYKEKIKYFCKTKRMEFVFSKVKE